MESRLPKLIIATSCAILLTTFANAQNQYDHPNEDDPRLQYRQCYECKSYQTDDDLRKCASDSWNGYFQRSCPRDSQKCVKYTWAAGEQYSIRSCADPAEFRNVPTGCQDNIPLELNRIGQYGGAMVRMATRCVCDTDRCNSATLPYNAGGRIKTVLVSLFAVMFAFILGGVRRSCKD